MNGGLEVQVVGTRVVRLAATPPLAAKVLAGADEPVVMVIGAAASLLAGDSVHLQVELAPGAALTLRSTAATIVHPCPEGESTSLTVDCSLGAGARLTWLLEPLIACGGCDHRGRTRIRLGPGATVIWLDSVTLGRTGEVPGRLQQRLDADCAGHPLLREGLRLGPGWDGPAVLGDHRHLANLHLLGTRLAADPGAVPGLLQLAGAGTTIRMLARRGDELADQVASVLPLFLHPGSTGPRAKEAVHV